MLMIKKRRRRKRNKNKEEEEEKEESVGRKWEGEDGRMMRSRKRGRRDGKTNMR